MAAQYTKKCRVKVIRTEHEITFSAHQTAHELKKALERLPEMAVLIDMSEEARTLTFLEEETESHVVPVKPGDSLA